MVAPEAIGVRSNVRLRRTGGPLYEYIPLRRAGTAEDVVALVGFFISEAASAITGRGMAEDGATLVSHPL